MNGGRQVFRGCSGCHGGMARSLFTAQYSPLITPNSPRVAVTGIPHWQHCGHISPENLPSDLIQALTQPGNLTLPTVTLTSFRPGGETISPRRWQFDSKIAADLRPSADGSAVRTSLVGRWPAVAQLQAAGPWDRLTDGQMDGRIALFRNAPLGGGIITYSRLYAPTS